MGSFLKKILEPTEEDAFDHFTWMEKPCINIFEGLSPGDVRPSPNVGLPSALIPRQPPGPAYVTHTGPLVRRLLQQERLSRTGPAPPRPRPRTEPRARPEPPTQPRTQPRARTEPRPRTEPRTEPSPARNSGTQEDSTGVPKDRSPSAAAGVRHMVIFARKPPSTALPQSNPACSSQWE